MACEKFKALESHIIDICSQKNIDDKTARYLINKATNLIRRAGYDVWYVVASIDIPPKGLGYTRQEEIEFHCGTMYLNITVD